MGPKVSISVTTYNQEKYIEQTLDSLLMQETNFEYEILINDDASGDRSPDIIRRYAKHFPDIIKPVFQKNNQYSQGKEVHYTFNYTRARGKYIAYCDGDDYWTDPLKLQKQFDYMEGHPSISACVHAGKSVNEEGTRILGSQRVDHADCYLDTERVIASQGMFASNSLFMRNYFTDESPLPRWFHEAKITDYPLYLILSTKGDLYYMDDVMCAFRVASAGSWTQLVLNDPEKKKKHLYEMIAMLKAFDEETGFVFSTGIEKQIQSNLLDFVMTDIGVRKVQPEEFQHIYDWIPLRVKIKLNISHYSPGAVRLYKRIKDPIWTALKPKEVFTADRLV